MLYPLSYGALPCAKGWTIVRAAFACRRASASVPFLSQGDRTGKAPHRWREAAAGAATHVKP
jgi:hypothetical protein